MAAITQFYMIDEVARMLGEDPEMLEAIVSNDDNLSYGNIVSVHTGTDEAITAVTGHGIEELREMILDARRSPQEWQNFLEDFVSETSLPASRTKDRGSNRAVTEERLAVEMLPIRVLGPPSHHRLIRERTDMLKIQQPVH